MPYLSEKTWIPYSRVNLPMNPTFYEYDLSAARRDFGYDPQLTLREMIDEALRYRDQGGGDIVPTAVNPRDSPSARSLAACSTGAVVVGPLGERCSVQAEPSQ